MDEVLVKYTQDVSQIESSNAKLQKSYVDTEAVGKKAFKDIGTSSEHASKKIDQVTQAAAKTRQQIGGLNTSINQFSRELPNLAAGFSTFFLSISNQFGAIADDIGRLKARNAELAAQNQATIPIWKQVTSAIFSWQTAMSVGVTLLTLYGGKLISLIGDLIRGSSAFNEARLRLNALNEAFASDELGKAVKDYLQLQENVKAAKNGLIDKGAVLKQYNDTVGRTVGFANSLNQAEKLLIDNKAVYVNAIAERTAALQLLDKTAELIIKKAQLQREKVSGGLIETLLFGGEHADEIAGRQRKIRLEQIQKQIDEINKLASELYQPNVEDAKQGAKKTEDLLVSQYKRIKALREAMGLDTFEISKMILERELSLLEKGGKEYLDKQNEIYVLIAARDRKLAEERARIAEEENKARIEAEQILLEVQTKIAEGRVKAARDAFKEIKDNTDSALGELEAQRKALFTSIKDEGELLSDRQKMLDEAYAAGLVSQQEYNDKSKDLEDEKVQAYMVAASAIGSALGAVGQIMGEQTAAGKALAIAETLISTYVSAQKVFEATSKLGPVIAGLAAGATVAAGLARVAQIQAVTVPQAPTRVVNVTRNGDRNSGDAGFATGVVDLEGPGTGTSDSIPARLSRGESVITAKATAAKKDELSALNYSVLRYDQIIQDKYVKPALEAERRKQESFAQNIAHAIHIHAAMGEKKIVKAIQESAPTTAKAIEKQTHVLVTHARKERFIKRHSLES